MSSTRQIRASTKVGEEVSTPRKKNANDSKDCVHVVSPIPITPQGKSTSSAALISPISKFEIKGTNSPAKSIQSSSTKVEVKAKDKLIKAKGRSKSLEPKKNKVKEAANNDIKNSSFSSVTTSPSSNKFGTGKSTIIIDPRVDLAYKLVRKSTGVLGGNGYDGAIYGELTMHSMQKVVNFLIENCEFSSKSRFIDIGAGLGKPNFHVSQCPAVRLSLGVELEEIRWKLSIHNLLSVLAQTRDTVENALPASVSKDDASIELYGGVNFIVNDIDNAKTTVYSYYALSKIYV